MKIHSEIIGKQTEVHRESDSNTDVVKNHNEFEFEVSYHLGHSEFYEFYVFAQRSELLF
jgi:hypothetical protein